jgi:hypothetical protein
MYTPAELLHRVMKWFDRAGRGQLHDLRQPLDPVFMGQGVDIVFPRDVFELGADDKLEFIGSTHDQSNPAVITVRAPRPNEKPGTRQGGFVFVVCRIAPKEMTRIRRAPSTLTLGSCHGLFQAEVQPFLEFLAAGLSGTMHRITLVSSRHGV